MDVEDQSLDELKNHVDDLLREAERQDNAKAELSRQGRQMLRVIFLGVSAIIAASAAFANPASIEYGMCSIPLWSGCLTVGEVFFGAISISFVSALFYIAISGIDFVAPYSTTESQDTKTVMRYQMEGKQYYCHRIGVLAARLEYNRKHIRALEAFGSIGGSALVISLLSLLIGLYTLFTGPISRLNLGLLLLAVVVPVVVAYFLMPEPIRRRELRPSDSN